MKQRQSLQLKPQQKPQPADELRRQLYSRLLNVALIVAAALTVGGFSAYAWFVNNPVAEVQTQQYKVYGTSDATLGMEIWYMEFHDEESVYVDRPINTWQPFEESVDFKLDPGDYVSFKIKVVNQSSENRDYNLLFGNFFVSYNTSFYYDDIKSAGPYKYTLGSDVITIPNDSFVTDENGSYVINNGVITHDTDAFTADKLVFADFVEPITNALRCNVTTTETVYTAIAEADKSGWRIVCVGNKHQTLQSTSQAVVPTDSSYSDVVYTANAAASSESYIYLTLWFDPSVTTSASVNFGEDITREVTMHNSNGFIGQTLEINKIYIEGVD